jgi:hypothetical protein
LNARPRNTTNHAAFLARLNDCLVTLSGCLVEGSMAGALVLLETPCADTVCVLRGLRKMSAVCQLLRMAVSVSSPKMWAVGRIGREIGMR